jgi:hypothetical protein
VPYGLIPLLLSIVLAGRYLLDDDVSPIAKVTVAIIVGASLVIWWRYPQWTVVATILQVAACIAVLIHLKVSPREP